MNTQNHSMDTNRKIIWMLQPPRSGGTLFCRLLDGHSKIFVFPTVFRFPKRMWPEKLKKKNLNSFLKLFKFMILKKFNKTGITKQTSNVKQKTYKFLFDDKLLISKIEKNLESIDKNNYLIKFFDFFFSSWKNLINKNRKIKYFFGHSTIINPKKYSANVLNFFKNKNCYLVIYIVRNPINWYLSAKYVKSAIKQFKNSNNISKYFRYYSLMLNQAINIKNSNNIIFINFDDLVSKPQKILKKFCKIIGIDYERSLLKPSFNGQEFFANSSFNLVTNKINNRVLKGKRKLTKIEINIMQKNKSEELFKKAKKMCL